MTDQRGDPHPDGLPEDDGRSDLQRVVDRDDDESETGVAHDAPDALTDPGMPDGVAGTGGVTKNQEDDAQ